VQEKNQTISSLKSDYASSIKLVSESLPEYMVLNSVSLKQAEIIVTGSAYDSLDVLTLSENLEKTDSSILARVKGIDPLEEGGVSFQVTITKKSR
jgi:hypothetical protein